MLAKLKPTKILGVWLQPDNNQNKQLAYMDGTFSWQFTPSILSQTIVFQNETEFPA